MLTRRPVDRAVQGVAPLMRQGARVIARRNDRSDGRDSRRLAKPPRLPRRVAAAAPVADTPVDDPNVVFIESPTIGTFYSKPKPESENYVKPGDMVTPDTVVCIVEAMKMFNEITAGVSGKIVECLVANEEPVDNNKPLFKVLKS